MNNKPKPIDVPPVLINNRVMVPIRFIAENQGAQVDWDEQTRTVTVQMDGQTLSLVIDQSPADFDTPPTIIKGRTFLPTRYVMEKLGADVHWAEVDQSVIIEK